MKMDPTRLEAEVFRANYAILRNELQPEVMSLNSGLFSRGLISDDVMKKNVISDTLSAIFQRLGNKLVANSTFVAFADAVSEIPSKIHLRNDLLAQLYSKGLSPIDAAASTMPNVHEYFLKLGEILLEWKKEVKEISLEKESAVALSKKYSKQLDSKNHEMDQLRQTLEHHEKKSRSQEARIKSLEARIESQEARIESQEARTESQEAQIESLKAQIESLEAQKKSQEARVESLEARTESLEARIESMKKNEKAVFELKDQYVELFSFFALSKKVRPPGSAAEVELTWMQLRGRTVSELRQLADTIDRYYKASLVSLVGVGIFAVILTPLTLGQSIVVGTSAAFGILGAAAAASHTKLFQGSLAVTVQEYLNAEGEFKKEFDSRVRKLNRCHEKVNQSNWNGSELDEIAGFQLKIERSYELEVLEVVDSPIFDMMKDVTDFSMVSTAAKFLRQKADLLEEQQKRLINLIKKLNKE